jgi:hypothetical protein
MRVFLNVVLLGLLACFSARAATIGIVAASYINSWIQQKWNVNLNNNPGNSIASLSYLYSAINKTNKELNGRASTYAANGSDTNLLAVSVADSELAAKIMFCEPGTYMPANPTAPYECVACESGHYCGGGGKIFPYNQVLSLAQVEANIPETDITDWEKISCCKADPPAQITSGPACATGTLEPGMYLFVERYGLREPYNDKDSIDGVKYGVSSADIAVFNRRVGYQSRHAGNIFFNYVDTNNETFTNIVLTFPNNGGWYNESNDTNVKNMELEIKYQSLCVYKHKKFNIASGFSSD